MKDNFFEYEEKLQKNLPFTYHPYEILEYIEGDTYDYVRYKVEEVNVFGSFQDVKDKVRLNGNTIDLTRRQFLDFYKNLESKVDINRETLKNVVEVSTDVRPNSGYCGHSWATISIGGKCQYVKFVDLNKHDMMDIVQFLKRYEAGRHIIDTPYNQVFEDQLFYFKKDNE